MSRSARISRSVVVEKNILRRRRVDKARIKGAKAERARVKRERAALAAADAESLQRAIAEANEASGTKRIYAAYLARQAAHYGGSIYEQQWQSYLKGKRPMPLIDQIGITPEFPGKRPQDLFPSWPFPKLTQVPPVPDVPVLAQLMRQLFTAALYEQMNAATLVALYLSSTFSQREAILSATQRVVDARR